jgi:hypothetical protein
MEYFASPFILVGTVVIFNCVLASMQSYFCSCFVAGWCLGFHLSQKEDHCPFFLSFFLCGGIFKHKMSFVGFIVIPRSQYVV